MTENRKEPLFNAGASAYDSFIFLHAPAERTAVLAGLLPGQKVLDIACGSGRAAMAAARVVGETGRVTGVDIADRLLDVAREKAKKAGLENVDYIKGDAARLEFTVDSFDAVMCASSIFLLDNIPGVLAEWWRVLKPGGVMVLSSFGKDIFGPVAAMIDARLKKYPEKEIPLPVIHSTDTPEKCREMLDKAGIRNTEIISENGKIRFSDAGECWRQVAGSLIVRPRLAVLDAGVRAGLKAEIMDELERMVSGDGIQVEVPVIYCIARRA